MPVVCGSSRHYGTWWVPRPSSGPTDVPHPSAVGPGRRDGPLVALGPMRLAQRFAWRERSRGRAPRPAAGESRTRREYSRNIGRATRGSRRKDPPKEMLCCRVGLGERAGASAQVPGRQRWRRTGWSPCGSLGRPSRCRREGSRCGLERAVRVLPPSTGAPTIAGRSGRAWCHVRASATTISSAYCPGRQYGDTRCGGERRDRGRQMTGKPTRCFRIRQLARLGCAPGRHERQTEHGAVSSPGTAVRSRGLERMRWRCQLVMSLPANRAQASNQNTTT